MERYPVCEADLAMSDESLVEMFPNEMMARLWAEVLGNEGIPSLVKPQIGGYGLWGHDSFIHHGLYVLDEYIQRARDIIKDTEGSGEEA
jgi:hypothetical protein